MSKTMITTKERYDKDIKSSLKKQLEVSNVMMVPRVEKIVINSGIGKLLKDKEAIASLVEAFTVITGRKPVMAKAKKSIAGFHIREGQDIGAKVTLHGSSMWDFIDRFVNFVLPRTRDFQGINVSAVDQNGNITIGIKDHTIFPEIVAEEARHLYHLQVTVVTSARSKEEGLALFRALGFPIKTPTVK